MSCIEIREEGKLRFKELTEVRDGGGEQDFSYGEVWKLRQSKDRT